jgi:hypothetical protein
LLTFEVRDGRFLAFAVRPFHQGRPARAERCAGGRSPRRRSARYSRRSCSVVSWNSFSPAVSRRTANTVGGVLGGLAAIDALALRDQPDERVDQQLPHGAPLGLTGSSLGRPRTLGAACRRSSSPRSSTVVHAIVV